MWDDMHKASFRLLTDLTEAYKAAILTYLYDDRGLGRDGWRLLYQGIDLLDKARVITLKGERTFRQVYEREIDLRLANPYIEQLFISCKSKLEYCQAISTSPV